MSSYALTGLIALAILSTPFTVLSIICYPLVIVPSPKFARFVFISTSVLALFAAYQLYTTNRNLRACNYAFHACEGDLDNATQQNVVLESKLDNSPMKGVAALRADVSQCEAQKSMLRWIRDDCRAHCEAHGQDVPWNIRMKIDSTLGQTTEAILAGEKEKKSEDGEEKEQQ